MNSSVKPPAGAAATQPPSQPARQARPRICVFCSTQTGTSAGGAELEAARALARALHERGVDLVYGGGTTGLMGELARERVRLGGIETVLGVIPFALVEDEREGRGKDAIVAAADLQVGQHELADSPVAASGGGGGGTSKTSKVKGMLAALAGKAEKDESEGKAGPSNILQDLPPDPVYGKIVGLASLAKRKAYMIDLVKKGGKGSGFIALPGGFGSLDEVLEVLTHRQLRVHEKQMALCNVDGFWDGLEVWMENASQKGFLGAESRGFIKILNTPEECVNYLLEWTPTLPY